MERRRVQGPLDRKGGLYLGKLFAGSPQFPSYATARGAGLPN